MESKQEFLPAVQPVAAFDEFRSQLNELQAGNSKAVFCYRDPKGNKEARSHVAKLRTTKAAIEKKRVAEKEEFLVKGRLVDADAKHLTAVVQSMIEVHETPLKEIEDEEKNRIKFYKSMIQSLIDCGNGFIGGEPQPFAILFRELEVKIIVDESWKEFEAEGHREKNKAKEKLDAAFAEQQKRSAELAELEKLRAESAERERKEYERHIAREAANAARIEAERVAAVEQQRIKDEAEHQARDQQLEIERAHREKAESEAREKQAVIDAAARELAQKEAAESAAKQAAERAEQQRLQAIADTEARIAREAAIAKAEADKLAANTAHRTKVKKAAKESFIQLGFTEAVAVDLVKDILAGKVANVTLNF